MYADHLIRPWTTRMLEAVPGASPFDCHNHVGLSDPSGFTSTVEELADSLRMVDGRSAVFPAAEPGGYEQANRVCAEAAAASEGRLVALTRLTPNDRPETMLDDGLAAGSRGVKLHGASDRFDLNDVRLLLAGRAQRRPASRCPR